jgi:hypothetical protein
VSTTSFWTSGTRRSPHRRCAGEARRQMIDQAPTATVALFFEAGAATITEGRP